MVPIALEAVMGLHYYFSKNVAIYSELGIAKSIIQAGVTIKL
jgi:predicted porin